MNKREIEDALRRAGEALPPGGYERASTPPVQPMEVHDYVTRQAAVPRRRRWLPALALLCTLLLGAGGFYYWDTLMPYSTLTIEAGVTVSFQLNRHNAVLSVEVDAGAALLEGRSYLGWNYHQALGAVVEEMDRAGYISNPQDISSLTAESRSPDRARILELDGAKVLRDTLDYYYSSDLPQLDHPTPSLPSPTGPSVTPSGAPIPATTAPVPPTAPTHHQDGDQYKQGGHES